MSNPTFLLLSMSYHWWNTHTSPSRTPTTPLAYSLHFPILSDLTVLPLFHPIFSCSSQCFNSIMDVHKAQFTSGAFSIISLVNSLAVPASPLHVFVEAGPSSLSTLTLLTLSLHQPDAQLLWQITPICLSLQHSARVKHMETHVSPAHTQKFNNVTYTM